MTDRDRLIELKRQAVNYAQEKADERGGLVCIDDEVDHLLANGVVVLPCEIGQKLYDVTEFFNGCLYPEIYELKENGMYIEKTDKGNIVFTYDGMYIKSEDIGNKIFLTKEEAEEKLKEREVE